LLKDEKFLPVNLCVGREQGKEIHAREPICKSIHVLLGNICNTRSVKKVGKMVMRAEPGVCAAASPGGEGQRRGEFSSADEQVGDPMVKIKTPG
jgi:hypothetical protein